MINKTLCIEYILKYKCMSFITRIEKVMMMNDNLYISLSLSQKREREKKKSVNHVQSVQQLASGSSLKCRHEYTRRDYLNKRSNQPLFNYLLLSNKLYDEHSSMNYFASGIIHTDVIDGLNYVIIAQGTYVLNKRQEKNNDIVKLVMI